MRRFDDLVVLMCSFFNNHNVDYFIRGGVAVILQGRFRTTEDIDVIIDPVTFPINEFVKFCEINNLTVNHYDLVEEKRDDSQITIQDFPNSIRIDLKYVFSKWEKMAIIDTNSIQYKNVKLKVLKPEYLIINKIYKGSRIDIEDAYSVFFQNKERLDVSLIQKLVLLFGVRDEYDEFMKRSSEVDEK